jgi:hypothetical protein
VEALASRLFEEIARPQNRLVAVEVHGAFPVRRFVTTSLGIMFDDTDEDD